MDDGTRGRCVCMKLDNVSVVCRDARLVRDVEARIKIPAGRNLLAELQPITRLKIGSHVIRKSDNSDLS